jgi:hypothetical protein
MDLEFMCGSTLAKLNEQVQKKIAEGWERRGDVAIIEPDYSESNIELPQFVYFLQTVVKEN